MDAVICDKLSFAYRTGFWRAQAVAVLHELSFRVPTGEVFGFLGPNGAGKTTTFKLLLQLLYPTSGTARVLGQALGDVATRGRIGYVPEQANLPEELTARECLIYGGKLCGMTTATARTRAAQLLAEMGLQGEADKQLRKFSKGMAQRVGLAQALMHDPELLLLDEPMSGLDPLGRRAVRDWIQQWRGQGKTIFFSSHVLGDVESLCDRVALLHRGRLLACDTLAALLPVERGETLEDFFVRKISEADQDRQ